MIADDVRGPSRTLAAALRRRLSLGAGAAVFALAVLAPAAMAANEADATAATPRYVKAACPDTPEPIPKNAECGQLTVPESRAKPNGRTIRLSVAIIPAKGKRRPDPIVWLAGGPGDDALTEIPWALAGKLDRNRDVIFMSQRGTYTARPRLTCAVVDRWAADTMAMPYDDAATGRAAVKATTTCRRRVQRRVGDLSAYNSVESAADLEDLRRALKIEEWNVYGISYGTDLALTYMRLHPKGIRAVGIDGIFPPSLAGGAAAWTAAGEGINAVFRACEEQRRCRERYPDIAGTFKRLVKKYEASPWTVKVKVDGQDKPVKVTISGGMLLQWAVSPGTHLAGQMPAAFDALANGDPEPIAKRWAEGRLGGVGILGQGLFYGVSCREWVPFETEADVVRSGREAFPGFPDSVLKNAPNLPFMRQNCKAWAVPKASSSVRDVTRSKIPTLVLSAQYDGQTAASNGEYVARRLKNSVAVTIPNVAHVAFASPSPEANECAQKIVRSFFDDLTDVDTSCTADVPKTHFVITREPADASDVR